MIRNIVNWASKRYDAIILTAEHSVILIQKGKSLRRSDGFFLIFRLFFLFLTFV